MTTYTPVSGLISDRAKRARTGVCERFLLRYLNPPSGIFDPRTVPAYDSNWTELGGLSSTVEN